VAFVVAYTISGSDVTASAIVALVLAVGFAIARLVRRESPRNVVSSVAGVALAAFIATRSGRAEDFFLPGLLANAAYTSAFLISLAVRRPLVGVIVRQLEPHADGEPVDARRRRAFERATWLWAGLFALRLAVQLPLYLAGGVVALGVARTAMGLPLFALGLWLTWLMVRRPAASAAAGA
jgi:hypothetical protein